jgi:hypothetical protein
MSGFIFPTDQSVMSLLFKTGVHAKRCWVKVMVFNTTFNNISVFVVEDTQRKPQTFPIGQFI